MKYPLSSPAVSARPLVPIFAVASLFAGAFFPPAQAEPPKEVESRTAATAGQPVLVVSEDGKTLTLEAGGRDVNIDGNRNEVTLHGTCHALTVSGSSNSVRAEAVASISTPGGKNSVTYKNTVDGEKPQVTDTGSGNSVEKSGK